MRSGKDREAESQTSDWPRKQKKRNVRNCIEIVSTAQPQPPSGSLRMNIQIVETPSGEAEEHGEYSARYSAKPFWAGFGDAWCWENDATPIGITWRRLTKDALVEQFQAIPGRKRSQDNVLGAHGRDPERGHRHMLLRDNRGRVVRSAGRT